MGKDKVSNRRIQVLRDFNEELGHSTTKKYVELLRSRDQLLQIGVVDIDVPKIIERRFVCDAKRCIQFSGTKPLIDRSCCCRYEVPTTRDDRERVLRHLDEVRPLLPEGHRLVDPEQSPFEPSGEYGLDMVSDNLLGGCQFNMYVEGQCRCVLHGLALSKGENPADYKPLACSLWPLAINDYDDDGYERFLVTIYCEDTEELFEQNDDEPFACLVDQDPSYPWLYQSERPILEYLFGKAFWFTLHSEASRILKKSM